MHQIQEAFQHLQQTEGKVSERARVRVDQKQGGSFRGCFSWRSHQLWILVTRELQPQGHLYRNELKSILFMVLFFLSTLIYIAIHILTTGSTTKLYH